MLREKRILASMLLALTLVALADCTTSPVRSLTSEWVGSWGASPVVSAPNSPSYNNQTLRLIVHSSIGGDEVRVRFVNTFGPKPLVIGAATIALQEAGAAIAANSSKPLTFNGRASVSIPPNALIVSDPVTFNVPAQRNLAISLFLASDAGLVTAHPLATQTSYVSTPGNVVATTAAGAFTATIQTWPFVAGVDVHTRAPTHAIVTFGDSITDGYKSTVDANRRWPNYLSERLSQDGKNIGVVNEGISGNRLLHDSAGGRPVFGPNALSRFDRDALVVSGATHIVVLLGINDIGMGSPSRTPEEVVSADEIIGALHQLTVRAHARGFRIIGATLTPFAPAAYYTEEGEQKRQAVNQWIRATRDFDGFIDFDRATRDPANPKQFLPAYDSGDHLHPNDAGYKAMADSIDLALFR